MDYLIHNIAYKLAYNGVSVTVSEAESNISHSSDSSFYKKLLHPMNRFIKRIIDIVVSGTLLVMCFPIFTVIAIAIKTTSSGPLFFRQERIGYKGAAFNIYKFRTMRPDQNIEEHKKIIQDIIHENEENQEDILAEYIDYIDSRLTFVGRFLRATSLDELPQLINILLGQMSLVGPRPHPLYEVEEYKEWYCKRLLVKPGLTGWSKLNLRLTPQNYEEAIQYDLWYVDHWNVFVDFRILLLTIPFVISMKDAR